MVAVIDIGSNSIRMSLYERQGQDIKRLLHQKRMTGLIGYVEDGVMPKEGLEVVCSVLADFEKILNNLHVEKAAVFSTASLRNIENTEEAVRYIEKQTGIKVDVISGEEEAMLDFVGVTSLLKQDSGLVVDIGGGSTELVAFEKRRAQRAVSLPMGSLNIYKKFVDDILPTQKEQRQIKDYVQTKINEMKDWQGTRAETICGVGGTLRAAGRLNQKILGQEESSIRAEDIKEILKKLEKDAKKYLLRIVPERIHTMIPGLMILEGVIECFGCKRIEISRYGVREGYLFEKVLRREKDT